MKYDICKITDGIGGHWYQIREEYKTFFSTSHNWFSYEKHRRYPPPAKFTSQQSAMDCLQQYLDQQNIQRLKENKKIEVVSTYEV